MYIRRFAVSALAALACIGAQAAHAADTDLSSPKSAALALAKAINSGDLATLRAVSVGTDEERKTAETMSMMTSSIIRFNRAVEAQFGKDSILAGFADLQPDMAAAIEKSAVNVQGDSATLINPDNKDDPRPMKLKRIDGKWKADLSSMGPEAKAVANGPSAKVAGVFAETAKEIEEGKYKRPEEVAAAIATRMQALEQK